ncbi:MAG: hypothetical protein WD877_02160 [Candidatus Saccharimonadales bacterium]
MIVPTIFFTGISFPGRSLEIEALVREGVHDKREVDDPPPWEQKRLEIEAENKRIATIQLLGRLPLN